MNSSQFTKKCVVIKKYAVVMTTLYRLLSWTVVVVYYVTRIRFQMDGRCVIWTGCF